jgi:nucleotide-binding universal stress UspA family protein
MLALYCVSLKPFSKQECTMYKRILLAYDGSETGQKALLDCQDLAQWAQSELTLVAVMPLHMDVMGMGVGVYDPQLMEREKQTMQGVLDEGMRRLRDAGHKATGEVLVGETVDEITKLARKISADLIVVGHRHLDSWAARWWRGSISKVLIEHSPCSVLVAITR